MIKYIITILKEFPRTFRSYAIVAITVIVFRFICKRIRDRKAKAHKAHEAHEGWGW